MALIDLFRPKWRHSNYQKRIDAIRDIDDQELLVRIARTEIDSYVKSYAIERIDDENELFALSILDTKNIETCIKKLNDKVLLKKLLYENVTWEAKSKILRKYLGTEVGIDSLLKANDYEILDIIALESTLDYQVELAIELYADVNKLTTLISSNLSRFSKFYTSISLKITDPAVINRLLQCCLPNLNYYELKKLVTRCPHCNSSNLFWDEYHYNHTESGPADSFYRETMTFESTETRYKLICRNCNKVLADGDTVNN